MSLDEVLGADTTGFTEVERIAHVASIRDALDAISSTKGPSADLLARKIKLLRLWCQLVKLRVESVRAEAPPPEHQAVVNRRGKTAAKLKTTSKSAKVRQASVEKADDAATPADQSGPIELRLLEDQIVQGVMLQAGATIVVDAHDAKELLESKMAIQTGQGSSAS